MLPLNYKLLIAYDGTPFLGWQKTVEGPSVEQELEKAIAVISGEQFPLQAASRTDRGVHAKGQVVNFRPSKPIENLHSFLISLNALLPDDIAVLSIEKADPDFHPTLDVKGKLYQYQISASTIQLPQDRLYSWHVHTPLDLALMREAASLLIGTHDFTSFTNQKKNEHYQDHIRTIKQISLATPDEGKIIINIEGNHFLYKMVRNLVGTLVYIGNGKLQIENLENILRSKKRTLAGVTAPAHGLSLILIRY